MLTVRLIAEPYYDGAEVLEFMLFQSRVDVSSDGFCIKRVKNSIYEINLPNEPSNWRDILGQYGKILD